MKALKTILLLLGLGILTLAVYQFYIKNLNPPGTGNSTSNKFIAEIENELKNLKTDHPYEFSLIKYNKIENDISVYTRAGKIDTSISVNLLKSLEFNYATVFIEQAYCVFKGKYWDAQKLDTIRMESNRLLNSSYITNKSNFSNINGILNEYDKLNLLVVRANRFSSEISVDSVEQKFDSAQTRIFIFEADKRLGEKGYPSNCSRLQSDLKSIRSKMYQKNLAYLSKKVEFCTNKFKTMNNLNEYYDRIYKPIYEEFSQLENSSTLYSVSIGDIGSDLAVIKDQLKEDYKKAQIHLKQ